MYLEIDEGFDSHPKTVHLCRVMGDANAGQYLVRLWAWACRSAPEGDLSGMEAADLELVMRYTPADGQLFTALTERWSTKFGPWLDSENGLHIHGWSERTGAALRKMEKRAAEMRAWRERTKAERDSTVTARSGHVGAYVGTHVGDKTRPDKTSPDKASGLGWVPSPTLEASGSGATPVPMTRRRY